VRHHDPSWKRTLRRGVRQILGVPEEETLQTFVEQRGARAFRSLERVLQGLGIAPPPRTSSGDGPRRSPVVERPEPTKFDLGPAVARKRAEEHIPWGYGRDGVTVMPVDPDRIYVYWEVTDEGMAAARRGLGSGGDSAWLSLRVYDVTGRIFDGTNAHAYFDHRVERHERQWFFSLGKPGSTVCVDVGMKSIEGYFVRIARSGRADLPRAGEVPSATVEWMTVKPVSGEIESSHVSSETGGASPPANGAPAHAGRDRADDARAATDAAHRPAVNGAATDQLDWLERTHGTWSETRRRTEWSGGVERTTWQAGPFPHPVAPPRYEVVEERRAGRRVVDSHEGRVLIDGPWSVTIRGIGAHVTRRVIGRWEIVRTIPAAASDRVERSPGAEHVVLGASEQHVVRGASELRLGAASELWLGGASEEFFVGASELRMRGASERLLAGASERRWGGASELLARAAGEQRHAGASERAWRGASEERLGGASELWHGGASEHRLAGSATDTPSSEAIERARASWQAFAEAGSRLAATSPAAPDPATAESPAGSTEHAASDRRSVGADAAVGATDGTPRTRPSTRG
jgi:hypothetical protein